MKFWQLVSIVRENPKALESTLTDKRWECYQDEYRRFNDLVDQQDREVLDRLMPEELVVAVLERHQGLVYLSGGHLRSYPFGDHDEAISYLEAYRRYGGEVLEDVLEKGSYRV